MLSKARLGKDVTESRDRSPSGSLEASRLFSLPRGDSKPATVDTTSVNAVDGESETYSKVGQLRSWGRMGQRLKTYVKFFLTVLPGFWLKHIFNYP
jgi:hypothetical protein